MASGPVGSRWAGRFRIFRYEIRVWLGGRIPDVAEAVDSPRRLCDDERCARRVLEVVPQVPTPVWGRDELGTGEMWNSNSVIAWAIARSGIDAEAIRPPAGGRAPGWHAGLIVARNYGGRRIIHRAAADADHYTPSAALRPSIPTAPRNVPSAARRGSPRRASGSSSTRTSASIAPAANPNENGSRGSISSTRRKATAAPTGCGALVATAAQNCRERENPAAAIGIATLVPSGMFWTAIAAITNRLKARRVRRVGRADCEPLGEAVDEEDDEDQDRGLDPGAHRPLDVALARLERAAHRDQKQHAGPDPGRDRARRTLVEPRQDQADDGGDPHGPSRDAEEQGLERRGAVAEQEHRDRPEPGGERGPGCGEKQDQHGGDRERPAVRGSEHQGGDDCQVDDDRE